MIRHAFAGILLCFNLMATGCTQTWDASDCQIIDLTAPPAAPKTPETSCPKQELPTCHCQGSFKYLNVPETSPNRSKTNHIVNANLTKEKLTSGVTSPLFPVAPISAQIAEIPKETCIDINQADEQHLIQLPGIGPGKAKLILQNREKRAFKKKKDLMRIRGIGPKLYRRMADKICEISPNKDK